ncbi:MAG: single-stranded-DNA-specific exonuclease RecJ [Spirochaetia bacterium]|nr:single-stranded-DNA-specific exonuclease RecJ [Spirochaetia bacterium]
MRYNKKFIESQDVKDLASRYKVSLLLASILVRRGITVPEELKFYLQDEIKYLHNPFLFHQMEDAVDRILDAVSEGERVMVFGDRDADGITSTVLMKEMLADLGIANPFWKVPEGDEPYGLTPEAVDYAAANDITLIITVDCGISNKEEIAYATEKSIDVIVLDHHTAPAELPVCTAIINPKVPDCGYPFRDLAGCGVVAKLIWALEFSRTSYYNKNVTLLNIVPGPDGCFIFNAKKLYNLVEVAQITETVVPGIITSMESTRLMDFFSGSIIITFGAQNQKRLFRTVFPQVDLETLDLAPEIYKLFPSLTGMGLLKMRELSHDSRYSSKETTELDVLLSLFKLLIYKKYPALTDGYEKKLPLVALGTIADLMPLVNENRILVNRGLMHIAKHSSKGLHWLLCEQKIIDRNITVTDVAWYLTPIINASGRMGVPSKAVNFFKSSDSAEVESLGNELLSLNKQRKKQGEDYWGLLTHSAKESFEEYSSSLVFTGGKGVPRGITGILASKFSGYYNAPSIIYTIMDDKVIGSVRSVRGYSIMPLLDYCKEVFLDYGGHDFAGGFSLMAANLEMFKKKIVSYVDEVGIDIPDKPLQEIDAELPKGYLTEDILDVAQKLNPYGECSPPLVFLAKRLVIKTLDIVGQKEVGHIKFSLDAGANIWPAIYWNSSDRAGRDLNVGDTVDAIFRVDYNYFRNKSTPQLVIIDMEKSPK